MSGNYSLSVWQEKLTTSTELYMFMGMFKA